MCLVEEEEEKEGGGERVLGVAGSPEAERSFCWCLMMADVWFITCCVATRDCGRKMETLQYSYT